MYQPVPPSVTALILEFVTTLYVRQFHMTQPNAQVGLQKLRSNSVPNSAPTHQLKKKQNKTKNKNNLTFA